MTILWSHPGDNKIPGSSIELSKTESGYSLRFPKVASFTISTSGKLEKIYPEELGSERNIEHLTTHQVKPRQLTLRGNFVLHASAVTVNGVVVPFIGDSGAGKSTLAYAISKREQFDLFSDDYVAIESLDGISLATGDDCSPRLWDESLEHFRIKDGESALVSDYSNKRRVTVSSEVNQGAIKALYVLAESSQNEIEIKEISGHARFITLIRSAFRFNPNDSKLSATEYERISDLIDNAPLFSLNYPRSYEMLGSVSDTVIEHIKNQVA